MSRIGGAPSISLGQGLLARIVGGGGATGITSLIAAVMGPSGFIWEMSANTGAPPRTEPDVGPNGNDGTDYYQLVDVGLDATPFTALRVPGAYKQDPAASASPGGVELLNADAAYPWTFVGVFSFPHSKNPDGHYLGFEQVGFNDHNGSVGGTANQRFFVIDRNGIFYGAYGSAAIRGHTVLITFTSDGTDWKVWMNDLLVVNATRTTSVAVNPDDIHVGYYTGTPFNHQGCHYAAYIDGYDADQAFVDSLWGVVRNPLGDQRDLHENLILDLFNGPIDTLLSDRNPDVLASGLSTWETWGDFHLRGDGTAKPVSTGWTGQVIDCGVSDMMATVDASFPNTTAQGGPVIRWVDPNNFWWLQQQNGRINVLLNNNGSVSQVTWTFMSTRDNNGMELKFSAEGTSLTVECIDSTWRAGTPQNITASLGVTNSTHQNGTRCGIQSEDSAGAHMTYHRFAVSVPITGSP